MRPPDPLLNPGRVRKQAKRRGRESRDFAGSIPASVTAAIPWSSGQDAWVTSRKPMVRIHPGSLKRRSVGVVVARRRGKAEDRVRSPDGPLQRRAVRSTAGHLVCTQVIGVRLPGGPLEITRAHGPTGRHQNGILEIRVRFPVGPLQRTEGSRIRLAGPHC